MIRTRILSLTLATALMAPLPALAHKVISSVFPSGDAIEGEVGFSNGDMAVDLQIDVFNEAGEKLGEARTDADGFFIYTPTKPVTHIFRGDLGAGHVAEMTMPADEVADIMGVAAEATPTVTPTADTSATGLSQDTEAEIAKMLRRELRPLRQEITALKNETNLQSILGGIGYIVGLFGFGFYIAARRQIGEQK
ncbi:cobalt ABC transporter permease [Phaeobacter sp. CNT1-3]|nr:cobalt ABC transporter permease [Phaeobacter sp. CNT1-3]